MQLKAADDRQPDLDALQALLGRPGLGARTRRSIEDEIWSLREGAKAERDAAYEIEFHLGENPHYATIHDLRLDIEGQVAQIDHLVISPVLEVFVCESKRFGAGVKINDLLEWTTFRNGRPVGVASPLEQNKRHIAVLERSVKLGHVQPPKRMGLVAIRPSFVSRVLIGTGASITRPRRKLPELDAVVKVDQFRTRLLERDISNASLLKLVWGDTLKRFGRQFVALHTPKRVDWAARFGVPPAVDPSLAAPARAVPSPVEDAPGRPRSSGHRCASCGSLVSFAVVKFCWVNKERFDGQILCMPCQQRVPMRGRG